MLACRQQEQGGEISIGLVFSGFTERPGQLALIGLSYLLANFTIAILMVILIIIIGFCFDMFLIVLVMFFFVL